MIVRNGAACTKHRQEFLHLKVYRVVCKTRSRSVTFFFKEHTVKAKKSYTCVFLY